MRLIAASSIDCYKQVITASHNEAGINTGVQKKAHASSAASIKK